MKKSKIIVPALGLLLLSTAASVSGTVAWFTANNKYNTQINTFAVVKTNDDLAVTLTPGVGTKLVDGAITLAQDYEISSSTVTFESKLTDSSFDPVHNDLVVPDANGEKVASINAATYNNGFGSANLVRATIDDELVADDEVKIYSAVTWKMTFKVSFGAINTNYALFLDNTADHSRFITSGTKTALGFRIAFVTENSDSRIWADLQTAGNCKYADSSTLTEGTSNVPATDDATAVDSTQLIHSGYNTALPSTEVAYTSVEDRPDCLGLIEYSANSIVEYKVTCVAYYEGTDPQIYNRDLATDYESVSAALHFQICKVTL